MPNTKERKNNTNNILLSKQYFRMYICLWSWIVFKNLVLYKQQNHILILCYIIFKHCTCVIIELLKFFKLTVYKQVSIYLIKVDK